ncbi:MAG: chromate transporter [Sphingopyxis sp.]|nr:chromate transporter [Sphingopyxis sp.]
MNKETISTGPVAIALPALFAKFLGFGMLAFGGPVAQIAMLREVLVEREGWVDPARFNRLLAVMQALPGPEAHELAVQIAVLAVILRAVAKIGQHMIHGRAFAAIAIAALVATVVGVPFWIPLLAGGLAFAAPSRFPAALSVAVALALAIWSLMPGAAGGETLVIAAATPTLAALFLAGLKGGLLTFGGAYTAIPYIREDTVGRGWLSDAQFLDGIALAGVLPAPLVIFATFAGYVAGGLPGALAITAGMFLPAFGFSLIFFERLEALVDHPGLTRFLGGIGAAAVGIIAATFADLALTTGERITSPIAAMILFAFCLAAVWQFRSIWTVPATLALAAVAGWMVPL